MAIRVTHQMLYGSAIWGMNKSLGDLMESNLQSTTMKKINRPSDDPSGTSRVMSFRSKLNTLARYQSNIDRATGWLSTIDSTLAGSDGSVQSILTSIKTLDLQGATGTVGAENREQISFALRGYFEQLINLANTEFDGYHIFAGHKTDQPAYGMGLTVDCYDGIDSSSNPADSINYVNPADPLDKDNSYFHVEGASSSTVIIQVIGPVKAGNTVRAKDAEYRCSTDGGKTWDNLSTSSGSPISIRDDGVTPPEYFTLTTPAGVSVTLRADKLVTVVDTDNPHYTNSDGTSNGTWLYVRPTAVYQGDDNDTQVSHVYNAYSLNQSIIGGSSPWGWTNTAGTPAGGAGGTPPAATVKAEGYFTRDVAVRIDDYDAATGVISYSYSLDDGNNWTQAKAPHAKNGTPPTIHLPVPGGYLTLSDPPPETSVLPAGTPNLQFIIHPHRADIDLQISESSNITVNMVGKDIFGGMYNYPGDGIKNPVTVPGPNLFETVGKLIAAAETNDQAGFQRGLEEITEVMKHVLTKAAVAGGREERLIATKAALTNQIYNEEEGLSAVEDIDVTELMAKMALQQTAYNAVLKSSSMIMQMSLVNFL